MGETVVSRASRRALAGLLHQQCWLWGCDVRRREGNLLVGYGVHRIPPPAGTVGTSAYRARIDDETSLSLWGFGVALVPSRGDALFLERYTPCPQAVAVADTLARTWHVQQLPARTPHDAPQAWWRLLCVFDWMAAYEHWVMQTAGPQWRQRCLHGWEPAVTRASGTSRAWLDLAAQIRTEVLTVVVPAASVGRDGSPSRPSPPSWEGPLAERTAAGGRGEAALAARRR